MSNVPESEQAVINEMVFTVMKPIEQWAAMVDADGPLPGPQPGSPLIGDDRATKKYRLSQAAWSSFGSAVDHLQTLRAVIVQAELLPVYSPFSLVRGALENAGKAVWLLEPRTRRDRVARRLRLAYSEAKNMNTLMEVMGSVPARPLAQIRAEIVLMAGALGITGAELRQRPGYEDIVKDASAGRPWGHQAPQTTWKVCSGFAHGDAPTVMALLEKESAGSHGGFDVTRLSVPTEILKNMVAQAVAMTGEAWRLYELRCTSPHTHR